MLTSSGMIPSLKDVSEVAKVVTLNLHLLVRSSSLMSSRHGRDPVVQVHGKKLNHYRDERLSFPLT